VGQQAPLPQPHPTTIVVTANTPGTGALATTNARITVHFTAKTKDAVVADTERRGLAFTFLMDQDNVEPFWHQALRDMREGGTKTLLTPASNVGLVMAGDPTLTLTIKLVKVAPL
jgi:FKBP-type peptidyl-prolyl cis-trans isomerase